MARQLPGQISLFEDAEKEARDAYLLRQALRYGLGHFNGYRVRVFAAFTYPRFQQYAHLFLRHERENGGGTIPGSYDAFLDANASGLRISCKEPEWYVREYSWPRCVDVIRELIDQDEWLTKTEEMEVGHIVQELGGLPYPRSRYEYPKAAWPSTVTEKDMWENRDKI